MNWQLTNILSRKRDAYVRLFLGDKGQLKPDAEIVLRDLKRFCRANGIIGYRTGDGTVDPLAMANANGRREVWDRLMRYIHLPEDVNIKLDISQEEPNA